ncbi:MAG: hypothetical protein D3922_11620 [Candidatus Electrothrix sp. AR1]|nr:hypothetical protein [Candidatus Electrothrix sp. AR1]
MISADLFFKVSVQVSGVEPILKARTTNGKPLPKVKGSVNQGHATGGQHKGTLQSPEVSFILSRQLTADRQQDTMIMLR